jgi:hypothetical protein
MSASPSDGARRHIEAGRGTLAETVQFWPTPRANENDQGDANRQKMLDAGSSWKGQHRGATLTTMAKLWPTPASTDWKGQSGANSMAIQKGAYNRLSDVMPEGGSLNPNFVEFLMGLPKDWTRLD